MRLPSNFTHVTGRSRAVLPFALPFLLLLSALGCERSEDAPSRGPLGGTAVPEWAARLDFRISGTRDAFESNTEIMLDVQNPTTQPLVIHGLESPHVAELVREGGHVSLIHALSVGVAKAFVIKPGEKQKTSLLFRAGTGTPRLLRLHGKEWPL